MPQGNYAHTPESVLHSRRSRHKEKLTPQQRKPTYSSEDPGRTKKSLYQFPHSLELWPSKDDKMIFKHKS